MGTDESTPFFLFLKSTGKTLENVCTSRLQWHFISKNMILSRGGVIPKVFYCLKNRGMFISFLPILCTLHVCLKKQISNLPDVISPNDMLRRLEIVHTVEYPTNIDTKSLPYTKTKLSSLIALPILTAFSKNIYSNNKVIKLCPLDVYVCQFQMYWYERISFNFLHYKR